MLSSGAAPSPLEHELDIQGRPLQVEGIHRQAHRQGEDFPWFESHFPRTEPLVFRQPLHIQLIGLDCRVLLRILRV